ncbi:MAG: toll/interleukin-1 receptor domain-containing protein [Candidatus Thiodiazotropha sp. (ex Ustalcina ferruginea)]|nr:toll/interleukin-1 receptor domain-containing protein [Candidatus Thiodiazotropha sp. (ex Ustalcina ferruginea)]
MSDDATARSGGVRTIFISYNKEDLETATRLGRCLREAGLVVLIQNESMTPGERIPDFINRAISDADAVLSLVSENSLFSAWVGEESMAMLNRGDQDKQFIGCYLDTTFLEPDFALKATKRIDKDIDGLEQLFDQHRKARLDTAGLNAQKTRLYKLRSNIGEILAAFRQSHTMDLRDENFNHSVELLLNSFSVPTDKSDSTGKTRVADPVPVEAPKSWLSRNAWPLFIATLMACVFVWSTFYEIPRLDRIKKGVDTASRTFLRDLGRQDANAIAGSMTLPFFFGDYEFRNPEDLRVFFEKLFQYAKSNTGQTSDSVLIRRGVALSTYLANEMLREDRDVFETVGIDIKPDLDGEKEEDRGMFPPPRLSLSDGSRATIQLAGFKYVKVIYLYYSGGHAAKFRGVLLVGDTLTPDT